MGMFMITEGCWKRSERVLVYEDYGCSRSATVAIAYLIKKNGMKLKVRAV